MTSLPDLEVYKAAENFRLKQVERIKDIPGSNLTVVIQPLQSNVIEACNARGGTPLGLKAQSHQCAFMMSVVSMYI